MLQIIICLIFYFHIICLLVEILCVWYYFNPQEYAARLAQLGERRSAEREVLGSNPGRTNTQGL